MSNEKKYVGKLSGFLNNPKKELNKKQDQMKALSAQDVRSMIPKSGPTEEQISASKLAPVQITIRDSNNDPVIATDFSIKKDNVEKTSGITDETGLCIYNQPEVMDVSIMPCSLEYEDKSVDLEVPEDATYASIEVSEDTNGEINSTITDIDDFIDLYELAPVGSLSNWNYTLDNTNKIVTLNYYTGSEENVIVYGNYQINGKIYKTRIKSNSSESLNDKYMFNGYAQSNCENIKSIIFSKNVDTSVTQYMNYMFSRCISLNDINILNLNTTNVVSMRCMFYACRSLSSINLSGFNTSNVTNMYGMFDGCSNLINLDLSNFNTSKVTTMRQMFQDCTSLINLNINSFNGSKVKDMQAMFRECSSLVNLDLSKFTTTFLLNILMQTFYKCSKLTSLDLRGFITTKVTSMNSLFRDCPNLKTIYVSSNWKTTNADTSNMFTNCGTSKVTVG